MIISTLKIATNTEFAGDDDNRNPYRVEDVACVDATELTDEALEKERKRYELWS